MKRLLILLWLAAFLITGCGSYRSGNRSLTDTEKFSGLPSDSQGSGGGAEAPQAAPLAPGMPEGGGQQAAAIERLVIQNADLAIVVADVDARMKAVEALAVKLGGYVVSTRKYQTYANNGAEVPEAEVTIRVPAERLDEALDSIKTDVIEIQSESRTGQDVTAEYVDLQSRLKNLEATESQLVKIMEQATRAEDALNVFNQLTSIREQIELVKGQMKYYEESAALSAVSLRIIAEQTLQPIEIAGWKPSGVAREAIQDLVYFVQGFADFLIRLVLLVLPALVLIAIPVYLILLGLRALVRRFRRPKSRPHEPAEK
jgi:hypothetical protein